MRCRPHAPFLRLYTALLPAVCGWLLLPLASFAADNTPEPAIVSRSNFPALLPLPSNRPAGSPAHAGTPHDARQPDAASPGPAGFADTARPTADSPTADSPTDAVSQSAAAGRLRSFTPVVTVGSSLLIVLGLFAALVWGTRKLGSSRGSQPLPPAVMRPLGHVMLDARTKLILVRCGRRVLVLSQTPTGVTPISEMTDPDEIRELLAETSAEARAAFESTLQEINSQPARGGFVEPDETRAAPNASRRLFATT